MAGQKRCPLHFGVAWGERPSQHELGANVARVAGDLVHNGDPD